MSQREKGSIPTMYDFDLHDFLGYNEDEIKRIQEWIESGLDASLLEGLHIDWLFENGYDVNNPAFQIPDKCND